MSPNPFESQGFAGFWSQVEREWAEEEKRSLYYPFDGVNDPDLGEEELCDYTDEECIGDKLFCEECPVLTGEVEAVSVGV